MPVAPSTRNKIPQPLRGSGPIPFPALMSFDPRYVGLWERFDRLAGLKTVWDYNATEDNTEVEVTNTLTMDWQLAGTGTPTCTRSTAGGVILTTTNSSGDDAYLIPNAASGAATNATQFNQLVWDFDLQNVFFCEFVTGASVTSISLFAGFKVDNDWGVDDADLFGLSLVSASDTSFAIAARRNSTDLFDSNTYGGSAQTRVYDTGVVAAVSTRYMVAGFVDAQGYITFFLTGANKDQPYVTTIASPGILSATAGSSTGGLRGGTSSVHPFIGIETNSANARTMRVLQAGFWQMYE